MNPNMETNFREACRNLNPADQQTLIDYEWLKELLLSDGYTANQVNQIRRTENQKPALIAPVFDKH